MDKDAISSLSNEDLLDVYKGVDAFLLYLEKERSAIEKEEDNA